MKTKNYLLTLILSVGFTLPFQSCCGPCDTLDFFDIKGMQIDGWKSNQGDDVESRIEEGDSMAFADYRSLSIQWDKEYIANLESNSSYNFSLLNSAWACDCEFDGYRGSKMEKVKAFHIITLNDFDSTHLKNDTITELFNVENNRSSSEVYLPELLQFDPQRLINENVNLRLLQAPQLNPEFKVKVVMELDLTNCNATESYVVETIPVVLIP